MAAMIAQGHTHSGAELDGCSSKGWHYRLRNGPSERIIKGSQKDVSAVKGEAAMCKRESAKGGPFVSS